MARITEDLVRKRAEHNECEIFSLEELSLHQQDIVKIEHLDRWCRDLKILYLQSNLIDKIENVGRLKKLEYLNLALNNIERIENLEGCESLTKLDLTVNFVGEVTSVESLRSNHFLEDLYLTGNPCVNFEDYRDYVIAALPQLRRLDGKSIEKSARIMATQRFSTIKAGILRQQKEYLRKRKEEKEAAEKDGEEHTEDEDYSEEKKDEKNDEFWNTKCAYTPESRKQMQEKIRENKEKGKPTEKPKPVKQRRFFNDEGIPMNMNEPKVDFTIKETEDDSAFILDVACYKFLDTFLIDVDVQPEYVRVTLKGQILQLALTAEVSPDKSNAQRSQTTGHLVLTMPKLDPPPKALKSKSKSSPVAPKQEEHEQNGTVTNGVTAQPERLEYDSEKSFENTLSAISKDNPVDRTKPLSLRKTKVQEEEIFSEDFVDDPDVPPLI